MEALLAFDFSSRIANRDKLAVWFAFLGEASSRPTYQPDLLTPGLGVRVEMTALFQAVIDEGGYQQADASLLAAGYISLVDGLWLNSLVAPRRLPRRKAPQAARHYLASAFPKHIPLEP